MLLDIYEHSPFLNKYKMIDEILEPARIQLPKNAYAIKSTKTKNDSAECGYLCRNNSNHVRMLINEYLKLQNTNKPQNEFFTNILDELKRHMNEFDVTNKSKRIHAIYAAFEVSRAAAYNTHYVEKYVKISKRQNKLTNQEGEKLIKYMSNKNSTAAKKNIHKFLQNREAERTCNDQMFFLPAMPFAIGKYYGSCIDEMLVDFYRQDYDNIHLPTIGNPRSHFGLLPNNIGFANQRDKKMIFLKLAFAPLFRHIFPCRQTECTDKNAAWLVWLLESLLYESKLLNNQKDEVRSFVVCRSRKAPTSCKRRKKSP